MHKAKFQVKGCVNSVLLVFKDFNKGKFGQREASLEMILARNVYRQFLLKTLPLKSQCQIFSFQINLYFYMFVNYYASGCETCSQETNTHRQFSSGPYCWPGSKIHKSLALWQKCSTTPSLASVMETSGKPCPRSLCLKRTHRGCEKFPPPDRTSCI